MHQLDTTSAHAVAGLDVLPTGHPSFDVALGVGGLARGRFVELQSSSALALSALTLRAAAETQARGGVVAVIDGQHSLDLQLAKALGVNVAELLVSQPDDPLMALEVARHLCRSCVVDLVIVEGLGSLVEGVPQERPAAVSEALRSLWNSVSRSRACLLFTTQPRSCMGLGLGVSSSLRHLSSVRCLVTRIGRHALIAVGKNKLAPSFTEATVDLQLPEAVVDRPRVPSASMGGLL